MVNVRKRGNSTCAKIAHIQKEGNRNVKRVIIWI